ncbi:hypothetical protein BYT27DRAFT_6901512 [Phlegmacium glaucopus]|nr:hypothetical protein BYT27DRAFT_6901512 [Phlegmacium glaucopus]
MDILFSIPLPQFDRVWRMTAYSLCLASTSHLAGQRYRARFHPWRKAILAARTLPSIRNGFHPSLLCNEVVLVLFRCFHFGSSSYVGFFFMRLEMRRRTCGDCFFPPTLPEFFSKQKKALVIRLSLLAVFMCFFLFRMITLIHRSDL